MVMPVTPAPEVMPKTTSNVLWRQTVSNNLRQRLLENTYARKELIALAPDIWTVKLHGVGVVSRERRATSGTHASNATTRQSNQPKMPSAIWRCHIPMTSFLRSDGVLNMVDHQPAQVSCSAWIAPVTSASSHLTS